MLRSKARWYEFGEKKSKYFHNLEKKVIKKHITSLTIGNDTILSEPKQILEEEANFYKKNCNSKYRKQNNCFPL